MDKINLNDYFEVLDSGKCVCSICRNIYSKYGIKNHLSVNCLKIRNSSHKSHKGWNKGLTKETSESVRKGSEKYKKLLKEGKVIHPCLGKHLSNETKKKISESMKKAHKEGRAWNIGKSRWNNIPSYPEKFFMDVIKNEFLDKDYIYEYPFYKFSLDFVWLHKKKVIEIDGEQHERFEEQKIRDKEKDVLLDKDGYSLLRVKWKDFCKDTKKYINVCKNFIDN